MEDAQPYVDILANQIFGKFAQEHWNWETETKLKLFFTKNIIYPPPPLRRVDLTVIVSGATFASLVLQILQTSHFIAILIL